MDGYKSVTELSRDELNELKMSYWIDAQNWHDELPWEDPLEIPDDVIFEHYGCVSFVEEDF